MQFFSYRDVEKQITWDSFGYYLYLPAVLIHQDPALTGDWLDEVYETYQPSDTRYQLIHVKDDRQMTKYSSGLAVSLLPGFLVGHLIASVSDAPADGFSAPYAYAVTLWACLLIALGVMLFMRFVTRIFDPTIALITTLGLVLGTNFALSTIFSPLMTHGILFTGYASLLYLTERWYRESKVRDLYLLAGVFGLMCLIRPTEIIALIIPLFWAGNPFKKGGFFTQFKAMGRRPMILSISLVVLIAFIQIGYWWVVSGKPIYYSYDNAGEGLDLASPYIWESLFSFRKGWWLYSPLCLVAFIGLFFLRGDLKKQRVGLILFTLLNIRIIASWTTWWYAASFGQRPYVQSYPLLFLGLAALIYLTRKRRWGMITIVSVLSLFSIFQSWQFLEGILPDDRITKKFYLEHFLATETIPGSDRWLLVKRDGEGEKNWMYREDYIQVYDTTLVVNAFSKEDEFVLSWKGYPDEIFDSDHAWFEVEVETSSLEGVYLVAYMALHKDRAYHWRSERIQSESQTFEFLSPHFRSDDDPLHIQLWNPDGASAEKVLIHIQAHVRNEKEFN